MTRAPHRVTIHGREIIFCYSFVNRSPNASLKTLLHCVSGQHAAENHSTPAVSQNMTLRQIMQLNFDSERRFSFSAIFDQFCETFSNEIILVMARLFSGRRKKLKCEAMASIMADCGSSHVTINFASSGAAGGLCASRVLDCGTESVFVPADIRELCDGCFKEHWSLRRVTFGPSSSLERIGVSCFEGTGVEEVSVPDGVRELCDGCFKGCKGLQRVTFGRSSLLERIGVEAFGIVRDRKAGDVQCDLVEINIPDGVRELCDGCFQGCKSLRRVTFGPLSSLERIGVSLFHASSGLELKRFLSPTVSVSCVTVASKGARISIV